MLALWRVMNCSVSGKKGKKRREKTIQINLSQNAGCTDVDTVTNYRAESVYQCCCLCSQEHTGLVVVVYICVRIVLLNKSVDTVHAAHTYRSTYIVCVCVWAADGEVLSYYQQGITVVKATLLFDCLPPDARPPGVALHFRTCATVLCHSISLSLCLLFVCPCLCLLILFMARGTPD